MMVDHLTGWPIARDIPDKEANAVFEKLIIEHGAPEISYQTMAKNSQMTLWPISAI